MYRVIAQTQLISTKKNLIHKATITISQLKSTIKLILSDCLNTHCIYAVLLNSRDAKMFLFPQSKLNTNQSCFVNKYFLVIRFKSSAILWCILTSDQWANSCEHAHRLISKSESSKSRTIKRKNSWRFPSKKRTQHSQNSIISSIFSQNIRTRHCIASV